MLCCSSDAIRLLLDIRTMLDKSFEYVVSFKVGYCFPCAVMSCQSCS